ncbi:MAG: hypothetical protein ACI8ZF_000727 [Candidatus Midichloriaceae bacterium]|jgi:hypothetical protein
MADGDKDDVLRKIEGAFSKNDPAEFNGFIDALDKNPKLSKEDKEEILVEVFIQAFEKLQGAKNDKDKFRGFYNLVKDISTKIDEVGIDEGGLQQKLDGSRGVFDIFDETFNPLPPNEKDELFKVKGAGRNAVSEMLDKAHATYDKKRYGELKEELAKTILKVSGVSEKQIDEIMQNPKAKAAIMKRVDNVLDDLKITKDTFVKKGLSDVKEADLQGAIEKEAKEVIAQVGRVGSKSLDGRDMRGKAELHEKYQEKANKMDASKFDKNAEKALEFEQDKDERGMGNTLLYNMFIRKPADLLNKLIGGEEPVISPAKTACLGIIAMVFLAPPAGLIIGGLLLLKAAKDEFYEGSKLQKFVDKHILGVPDEKFKSEELEKVTVNGLMENISRGYEAEQDSQKGKPQVAAAGVHQAAAQGIGDNMAGHGAGYHHAGGSVVQAIPVVMPQPVHAQGAGGRVG